MNCSYFVNRDNETVLIKGVISWRRIGGYTVNFMRLWTELGAFTVKRKSISAMCILNTGFKVYLNHVRVLVYRLAAVILLVCCTLYFITRYLVICFLPEISSTPIARNVYLNDQHRDWVVWFKLQTSYYYLHSCRNLCILVLIIFQVK